ncbi:mitosis inhibitor protein kinase swe1 [Knufia obscura]|uniref:Mitosis inhibitor protein kinase swe1 n=2 Tax=Knufia TaxID=430999 RepID=A0AAN8F8E9_9EURO|nr:mitosis inhibitor protein kinase swe1 [Knufia obscura]KAK5953216.1 mitosis inhibitor protein kinase swe1 [Knufia fluminis]
MLTSYSPQREGGGMMQLHSPTHNNHHYDPHSAIREIRRSLSRSPSKPYNFRSSIQSGTPYQPSPLSPSRKSASENFLGFQSMSSPNATRSAQPGRIQRPTLRRTAQTISTMRTRTSPKSPSKRTLTESNEPTHYSQALRKRSSAEIDADDMDFLVEEDKENISKHNEEQIMSWKTAQTKQEKRRSGGLLSEIAPMSPMKRNDGVMNIDQDDFISPSAKRRSLHAPSTLDFSIFESDNLREGEQRSQDDHDWFRNIPMSPASRFSTIPKRSSSLRKSTLQQRQSDRSSPLRLNNFTDLRQNWSEGTPNAKKPSRTSLNLPAPHRDSPFSSQGDLLNASIHPMISSQEPSQETLQFRHPLAATMTQSSSSTGSVQDDSPTHEPPKRVDRSKSHDFSKSLPIGAFRPQLEQDSQSTQVSSQGSFATPGAFKTVKPHPAAFMSTGLISKKNRNINEADAGLPKAHMPDTPCKKQTMMFPPPKAQVKPMNAAIRNLKAPIAAPNSPSEAPFGVTRTTPFPWASRSSNLFSLQAKKSLARKASFASLASIEADDKPRSQSPSVPGDSQSTEGYPPTPTKPIALHEERFSSISPSPQHVMSRPDPDMSSQAPNFTTRKLSPIQASPDSVDGDSDSVMDDSPSARLKPSRLLKVKAEPVPYHVQSRRSRPLDSPTPLSRKSVNSKSLSSPVDTRTKLARSPVTPHLTEAEDSSPHTPLEAVFPPDPSTLSISGKHERPVTRNGNHQFSPYIPETPTGPKEYFGNFSNRPSLNLNAPELSDVDPSLSSRFEKVELAGSGEFSQVYRVAERPQPSPFRNSFVNARSSSRNSLPEKVWAVKKSRHPYSGPKDRARKIHEVDVLKALGHNDHILSFNDSWEDRGHLYIQTEFCEEGTLDVFLMHAGVKARIDDFRIWKILLELSQGVKHIHDMGYIHLDLKPANILITFEGVLKIGDFGMATKWPAKAGIEGEGDREYIGPEILMGRFDKPADVFALGLIMLEIAGNVALPDNGTSWQKLRNGDMSDVPSLTFSSEDSILRDAIGNPMEDEEDSEDEGVRVIHGTQDKIVAPSPATKATQMARRGELVQPPSFMTDPMHEGALDNLVRWMILPNPDERPQIGQVLESTGVQWAEYRRRAGATIFEGNWGPADHVLAEDTEMIDM